MGDPRSFESFLVACLGALLLLVVAGCGPAAGGSPTPSIPGPTEAPVSGPGDGAGGWQEVDRLTDERKYQAALERVTELRRAAREAGDEAAWTRALVREVQLQTGLHGYESSVRHLLESPWPERPLYRAILELYLAHSLVDYLQVYGWEIGQRERVASPPEGAGDIDLRAWTREQIGDEIDAIFRRLWERRASWGDAPLGELGEYFHANSYPPRIRGTLRDAVAYLWVERLADSSTWSAAEENGVYRLELAELIAPAAEGEGQPQAEAHPLTRLADLLADLEAWHRRARRVEAAFEARLERLRRLWVAFPRAEDRTLVRAALERALAELGRRHEWWSVGQEQLARWVAEGDGPDSQVAARALALTGIEAHPESIGGQRCRHLVAGIEAPEFHLEAMLADGTGERSLRVRHRNLERLYFRAYRLDPLAAIEGAEDYNLLPGHREVEELVAGAEPVAAWPVELPPTPDYRLHQSYVRPPVALPGLYVLVASARSGFADDGNRKVAVQTVLGELVLLSRKLEDELEITVREGGSGAPAAGAEVRIYRYDWRRGHRIAYTGRTGADGTAAFPAGRRRESYFAVAVRGDEVAIDPSYLDLLRRPPEGERTAALIYTDRSVYRPGQELLWKAVAYRGRFDEGSWRVVPGREFDLKLLDANGELVDTRRVTSNEHGSASGSFTLPHGRLLGGWRLEASLGGIAGVRVEEYKRPTFEVEIAEPAEPLRLNRPAALRGEARYYFGLPVAAGELTWRVTREPVWSFHRWWWRPPPSPAPETVAAGAGRLGPDGGFTVEFTPEADERRAEEGVSFRYRLSVDVTDEGGETRSASRAFRLGFVAVEAAIELERGFLDAGAVGAASILRTDLDGAPRAGAGSWRLVRVRQPEETLLPAEQPVALEGDEEAYRTPGDLLRPRWDPGLSPAAALASWPDAEELVRGELEHGEDGVASFRLPALAAGAYRIRYETRDPWGARFESARELLVAEEGATPLALPAVLIPERSRVPPGETIRLLVHSGLDGQELVLELLRGERRIERRRIDSRSGLQIVELPATAEHRGGLGVRLTVLRDHQLMSLTESVHVPWDDRRLELSFASFRDRLRPGQQESWRVTVRGADEETLAAGSAELLAYMYDRSLDIFAPHQPPDVATLYPLRAAPRAPESSLGVGGEIWARQRGWADLPGYPHLAGDRLVFYDGYGIGGPGRRGRPVPMAMRQMGREMVVAAEMPANADVEAEGMTLEELSVARKVAIPDPTPDEPGLPGDGPELRTDFSETAFWEPHLVLGERGEVAFEFTVPDSVTEWSVWVHALTRDLAGGSLRREARSVKELMVRPYLPRFLREGDRAVVKVVVNNASEAALAGELALGLEDPESGESLTAEFGLDPGAVAAVPFRVEPGGGAELAFELTAPVRVGEVAVRAVARAGEHSDGELRPLPLLPGRLHLAQSRFAVLEGAARRELTFARLAAADDPSRVHDQLVVTLDGQLFTSVLRALPYLVSFPYECTEQTANRFISSGILTSLYDGYPAVARLARQLAERETQFESFDAEDPNRKMALVETPWLVRARGGRERDDLIRVLDPRIARANRRSALAKLERAQTSLGGFPWWPGGPPSPYMTLYLLHGFAKAVEFEVEVPKPMVRHAWAYMHRHYLDELARRMVDDDCCWEMVTFLNYVLSAYPDESWTGGVFTSEDRERMLEHSFAHWRDHSPYLKGYLALTLARAGREADAELVFDSLMDSSKTDPDLGTYWAPEERAWLWYNDTIEGHAFALRTMTELSPADPRRHGLVQWLLLNKKLNHWKSTRATAEVLYAMVHYLEREGALGVREEVAIEVGPRRWRMSFEPDALQPEIVAVGAASTEAAEPLGRPNQIVVPGPDLTPAMATTVVEKSTPGFLFASATWHFSTGELPEEAEGDLFRVERRYFRRVHDGREWTLEPLADGARVEVGDAVEVQLSIRARHAAEYVHLRDPRGAGFEPETLRSGTKYDLGIFWYEEVRDSGTNFFFEWLPAGEYTFRYRLRAATAGTFRVGPATLQSMYAPEFTAYSAGDRLAVE